MSKAVGCMGTVCTDFKAFISRGNVVDLAVGIILGTAFGAVVKSMVSDILMPLVSLGGDVNLENMFAILKGGKNSGGTTHTTVEEAQKAGAITLNYGRFADAVINFLVLSLLLFLIIQLIACCKRKEEAAAPSTDFACPKCAELCKEAAVKCPHCGTEPILAKGL